MGFGYPVNMQSPINYVVSRVNNYFESREKIRFEKRMELLREQTEYIISQGEEIRRMHNSPEAWILGN